jgi:hypothetical protein
MPCLYITAVAAHAGRKSRRIRKRQKNGRENELFLKKWRQEGVKNAFILRGPFHILLPFIKMDFIYFVARLSLLIGYFLQKTFVKINHVLSTTGCFSLRSKDALYKNLRSIRVSSCYNIYHLETRRFNGGKVKRASLTSIIFSKTSHLM